jgi:hypothetical protein
VDDGSVDDGTRAEVGVEAGTGAGAVVYFWMNQGMEVPFEGTVSPATLSATGIVADQSDAAQLETLQSPWDSGKPGKKIVLSLLHFPIGWVEQVRGRPDYPQSGRWTDITRLTVRSSDITKAIVIPKSARPGYVYWIAVDHVGGALSLRVPYQVCSLKASRTRVTPGGTVRLSGVVPVQGHWGSRRGVRKTLILYSCPLRNAVQPAQWNPESRGWRKIATLRTDGYGRFTSRALRLKKSSSFVVRYPGDDWYWGAYTSPVSVLVK